MNALIKCFTIFALLSCALNTYACQCPDELYEDIESSYDDYEWIFVGTYMAEQLDKRGGIKQSYYEVDKKIKGNLSQLPLPSTKKLRSTDGIQVFSVVSSHGFILLPSKAYINYDAPCMKFEYNYDSFTHGDKNIAGGFKCSYSISTWWEHNLVFNLQGKNIKTGMKHLYAPQFYIRNGELRVGEALSKKY